MAISTHETRFMLTAKDRTKGALKSAKMNLQQVGKAVTGVHAKILGLAGIGGMGALLGGIINTNQEMQTLKSSLKTVTGSAEDADRAFQKIENFAITTPFDLNAWTEAFIKMKSLGLDPSEKALTSYGNTAAAMGKSLNQMIEAVADASSFQFERLRDFGITASTQGDQVAFTFQGITTTVAKNSREIEQYLQSIGNNQFGDAMADQMNNLAPAFSNLGQAFQTLAVKIGEAGLNDLVINLTRSITAFVNSMGDTQLHTIVNFFKSIGESIAWVANLFSSIAWLQGDDMLQQWQKNNPSQIGGGSVPGGYQIGDFNRSNGSVDQLSQIRRMEEKYGSGRKAEEQREKTNLLLEGIADGVQRNSVSVAG